MIKQGWYLFNKFYYYWKTMLQLPISL